MSSTESSQMGQSKALFEIKLTEHSLHGGYIYIPFKFRHLLPATSDRKLRLVRDKGEILISWKLDNNGRVMADSTKGEQKSLRDWFRETAAKPGDILRFGVGEDGQATIEMVTRMENHRPAPSTRTRSLATTSEAMYSLVDMIGMKNMLKLASIGSELESVFKEGTDKALNAELCTNQPIDQCVRLISHDPLLMRFFDRYWESTDFKRVFSYRPIQLIYETQDSEDEPSKNLMLVDFQPPTPVDMAQVQKMKDVQHARLALKYQRLLEEYNQFAPLLKDLLSEIENVSDNDSAKAELFANFLELAKNTLKNPEIHKGLVDLVTDVFHDPIPMAQSLIGLALPEGLKNAEGSIEHITRVCRLTHGQYGALIDELSEMKLLSNAVRVHWCPYHVQDPFYTLSVLPMARFLGSCPHCGQQLSSVGWSMIYSDIFHFMRHKDGLMTIAIAWYAQKNGWVWKSNQVIDNQEIDLRLQKQKTNIFIETKTLMSDNDYTALRRKTLEELRKFERKRGVIKAEPGMKNFWLFVVNLPHDLLATLKLRSDADVSVISIDDFKDTVEKTILPEK